VALRTTERAREDGPNLNAGDGGQTDEAPTAADLVALATRLQAAFLDRGLTLATAESCTGGLIAHVLTEISGSSGYVVGGVVAYSNQVKQEELGVPAEMLNAHGAVSAQTARAMAEGARRRLRTSVATSVTGVAGPQGGSEAKPVGLTYVGIADADGVDVRRFVWPYDRSGNKRASAAAALTMLLERVEAPAGE
jgi:PncC family amidohydrolase